MAGSLHHCYDYDRRYSEEPEFRFDLIENMGDAHEACEEMVWMILWLTNCDADKIKEAEDAYHRNARGETDEGPFKAGRW